MSKNINFFESQYKTALRKVLRDGVARSNRTKTDALSLEGPIHFEIDVAAEGLPALRGKKMFPLKALAEAYWIMLGQSGLKLLHRYNVHYWDAFADWKGKIYAYGPAMLNLYNTDQLDRSAKLIMAEPDSRQNVISLWGPSLNDKIKPCYLTFQFMVQPDGRLNLHVTQRSGDAFLGVPTDAMVFSYILGAVAAYTGKAVGKIYYTINNFHLYVNHLEQVKQYLKQSTKWELLHKPMLVTPNLARLKWTTTPTNVIQNFLKLCVESDLSKIYYLQNYKSLDFISAPISI